MNYEKEIRELRNRVDQLEEKEFLPESTTLEVKTSEVESLCALVAFLGLLVFAGYLFHLLLSI